MIWSRWMSLFKTRYGRNVELEQLRHAYQAFRSIPVINEHVLPDLAEFCRALDPAPREGDLFIQGRAAGRRDVWLRIQEHLHLTEDELFEVYRGRSVGMGEG
jgi:hypothetical protein